MRDQLDVLTFFFCYNSVVGDVEKNVYQQLEVLELYFVTYGKNTDFCIN